jgi:general nucleoside transport system ATP-binding protein
VKVVGPRDMPEMPTASSPGDGERTAAATFALELRQISKRFGLIEANRAVDLRISPGEIRGLVGENGAGKSTLMAIASGLDSPDAGQILVDGVVRELKGRDDAIALGINMVHQHFMLIPNCTVAQNVVLGEPGGPFLRLSEVEGRVRALGEHYGIEVDPCARVESLTPTERQRVEILTALWRGKTVLILDEPTSVLGPTDTHELFATMRRVAAEGCAVVFTSHKLREVIEVCDTISVMRHGDLRTTVSRDEVDVDGLAALMVGETLSAKADSSLLGLEEDVSGRAPGGPARGRGTTVLRLVEAAGEGGGLGELTVAPGEIVGVAGVEGNGQRALAEALVGLSRHDGCRVEFEGEDITALGPLQRNALGMAYVPEDPTATGLIPDFPVTWNLALRDYRTPALRTWRWFVDVDALRSRAALAIQGFDIRGATEDTRTAALSGGNQQKVVLARELDKDPKVLVIVDPTVGLDVGAAQNVHRALRQHRDRGAAIVLISTDLDEIEALSDRIAVLYRGSIVDVVSRAETERRTVGLMMTGLAGAQAKAADRNGTHAE